jgi:hypothetical protein
MRRLSASHEPTESRPGKPRGGGSSSGEDPRRSAIEFSRTRRRVQTGPARRSRPAKNKPRVHREWSVVSLRGGDARCLTGSGPTERPRRATACLRLFPSITSRVRNAHLTRGEAMSNLPRSGRRNRRGAPDVHLSEDGHGPGASTGSRPITTARPRLDRVLSPASPASVSLGDPLENSIACRLSVRSRGPRKGPRYGREHRFPPSSSDRHRSKAADSRPRGSPSVLRQPLPGVRFSPARPDNAAPPRALRSALRPTESRSKVVPTAISSLVLSLLSRLSSFPATHLPHGGSR